MELGQNKWKNKIGPRIRIHITMDEVVTALFSGWGGG